MLQNVENVFFSQFLAFLLVSEGPGMSRKVREVISLYLVVFRSKSDSVEPNNEEKTVMNRLKLTTIKATTIYMRA